MLSTAKTASAVHRKGAKTFGGDQLELNSHFKSTGQPVLVPGDMGTGSWIMSGPVSGQTKRLALLVTVQGVPFQGLKRKR